MLATSGGDEGTPTASPRLTVNSKSPSAAVSVGSVFKASFRRHGSCSSQTSINPKRKSQLSSNRTSPLAITSSQANNMSNSNGESGYQETCMRSGGPTTPPPISPVTNSSSVGKVQQQRNNHHHLYRQSSAYGGHHNHTSAAVQSAQPPVGILRRCNVGKSLKRKKRVIQMLSVVVAEFFVCWTPLYVMVSSQFIKYYF